MNKKKPDQKRADLRFHSANGIAHSLFNKTEPYVGIAKNISHDGMFFLSRRQPKPGIVVCIQPLACKTAKLSWKNGRGRRLANDLCTAASSSASTRKFFANIMTAEVKRSQVVDESTTRRYGVGVNFLQPTV
jgi:hypothetical protein